MGIRDEVASWEGSTIAALALGGVSVVGAGVLTAGAQLWAAVTGQHLPWNPVTLIAALIRGQPAPSAGLWLSVGAVIVVVIIVAIICVRGPVGRRVSARTRADKAARLTGSASETRALSARTAQSKAKRLEARTDSFGLPIGRSVRSGDKLWSDFEAVCLAIAGPRTGKTTCWVIPRIFAAPGFVLATSNKRDIVDDTKARRQESGRVWVFDPQSIAGEPQTWWWDIMSYVTDAVSAKALTQVFVDSTRDSKSKTDAFFDSAGQNLVSALLLAAARGGRPLSALHAWLNNQSDDEPVHLLREAGEDMMAQSLKATMDYVPETRSGVYATAQNLMAFMLNDEAMRWVSPSPWLEQLDPEQLVCSRDTLYCLSQEGRGSAAPIVTALTVAVIEAALKRAKAEPGGRLPVPMLVELDEAANVCRWRELPDLYSHFGSRGVLVDTVLQSWSQGGVAWGDEGIKKMWSAANVKIYGGGVSEKGFLSDLSEMIGSHWIDSRQTSYSSQGRSSSSSREAQQRQIATVAELASLPQGRAWVFSSGAKPALIELIPYYKKHGKAVGRIKEGRAQ